MGGWGANVSIVNKRSCQRMPGDRGCSHQEDVCSKTAKRTECFSMAANHFESDGDPTVDMSASTTIGAAFIHVTDRQTVAR